MSAAGPVDAEVRHGVENLPPLRDVIRRHDLAARRSLGQNFLLDLNLTGRIARAAGPLEGVTVIEVGPGPGGLTRALIAEGASRVIAIERDERCLAALEEIAQAAPGRLQVIAGDALKTDYAAIVGGLAAPLAASLPAAVPDPARGPAPVRIVANLPYNIGTALLVDWLTVPPWPPWFDMLVLMFQREVAERIVAPPGSKSYGRLAVLAQWRTEPRIVFDVAPSAFVPPPKVTSSVVRLVPRPAPLRCDLARLERVTAAAFGQRRKMLRQSLRALGRDPAGLLAEAGIAETERAENVSIEGFVALARALERAEAHALDPRHTSNT